MPAGKIMLSYISVKLQSEKVLPTSRKSIFKNKTKFTRKAIAFPVTRQLVIFIYSSSYINFSNFYLM